MKVFFGLAWSLTWIAGTQIFFAHTTVIRGWTSTDVLFLLFTFECGFTFSSIIGDAVESLGVNLRTGRFDNLVTKPIDAQFLSAFGMIDFSSLVMFFFFQLPLIILLAMRHVEIRWELLPVYLFLLAMANMIWLSMKIVVQTLNFWWENVDNLDQILFSFMELGKYPIQVFPKVMQALFHTILPIAFVATIPADILLRGFEWQALGATVAMLLLAVIGVRTLWNRAIRRYTSASS